MRDCSPSLKESELHRSGPHAVEARFQRWCLLIISNPGGVARGWSEQRLWRESIFAIAVVIRRGGLETAAPCSPLAISRFVINSSFDIRISSLDSSESFALL